MAKIDLRQDKILTIDINENVAYFVNLQFSKVEALDTGYTLEINNLSKTIGNGLNFTPNNDGVIIEILNGDFPVGTHKGCLISDTRVSGKYLNIQIIINCYADNC